MLKIKIILLTLVFIAWSVHGHSQKKDNLSARIAPAPAGVFNMFREAGMKPVNHVLTKTEKAKVEKAFSILPPLHRKILQKHLHSISFMDNMPNNGLTSPVGKVKMFNITLRAGILEENISHWAARKEKTSFDFSADSAIDISVEAGNLDAIQYVLLHEASHVVDVVLQFTPHVETREAIAKPTAFTEGIWEVMNKPVPEYADTILRQAGLRNKAVPVTAAASVYKALKSTPFVSLYARAAWSEDFAEFVTIYHLTEKLKQPYRVVVKRDNKELVSYEPMQNDLVLVRKKLMDVFYE